MSDIVERLRSQIDVKEIPTIIREAADEIEELRKQRQYDREVFEKTIDIKIAELEAERKKREWISVKDRLPEKHRASYLCLTNGGYCHEVRWTNNVFGLRSLDDEWGWSIFNTTQYSEVTHWMPLPEPAKGEEDATVE